MVGDLIPDSEDTTELLRNLRAGSEFLESRLGDIEEVLEGKAVLSFYELLETPTVRKVRLSPFTIEICANKVYKSPLVVANMKGPGIWLIR
jgi:hypothetical protein